MSTYTDALWQVQNNRPSLNSEFKITSSDVILDVDLDTRKITTPSFLAVQGDHQSDTIYFRVNRYFEFMDLADLCCVIQYTNANGDSYLYPVPSYDVQTYAVYDPVSKTDQATKILIPWCILGAATAKAGKIKFSIKFFKMNNAQEVIYELNTLVAESNVLEGQGTDLDDISENSITLSDDFMKTVAAIQEISTTTGFQVKWVEV